MEKSAQAEKDMPELSVIVPVYNVKAYLAECFDSILSQTFGRWEIVAVDDGSTDGSGMLCERYARADSRIRVIHQDNAGLAAARNAGLMQARGRTILFLDSDDFYPQADALQRLAAAAAEAEVVCFNYARYTRHLEKPLLMQTPGELPPDADERKTALVAQGIYTSSACLKAVRRALLQEHAILFENGVLSEDVEWSGRLLAAARQVDYLPGVCYAYRVREGSISRRVSLKNVEDLYAIIHRMAAQSLQGDGLQTAWRGYVSFQYATLMINVRICDPRAGRALKEKVRADRALLNDAISPQACMVRTAVHLLGYRAASLLLTAYFMLVLR